MAELIIPDKTKHSFVVGIDFGHGETSAAICKIEWDTDAQKRETRIVDIDLDRAAHKKVISSSICHVADGLLIGDEAFEHMTDNNGIRICFKQQPTSLDGEQEKLMVDYMRAVYAKILENYSELNPSNHIVYIARPSGWTDEQSKELYRLMALQAGIPLAGLTSESRAAIFYAKSPHVNFAKVISKGAIVFDLGSSTLDFTYLSDTDKPIDFGYNLGASIIDEAILDNMILKDENVNKFIQEYPSYRDALKFRARKFKEEAYGRNPEHKTVSGFTLGNIISDQEESFDKYADIYVKFKISNLAELNDMVEKETQYMSNLKKAIVDFKENKIPGKQINGVFMTGGASSMNFIRPMVAEVFGIPIEDVRRDDDNTSLTVSRGIALLGATDAITYVLCSELRKKMPALFTDNDKLTKLRKSLAENISEASWEKVESTCEEWITKGTITNEKELKQWVENSLKVFQDIELTNVINRTLNKFILESSKELTKSMNDIISRYAPGREISFVGNAHIGNIQAINDSLNGMSRTLSEICDSITNILKDILWAALGVILWGVFCAPYYLIKFLRPDKYKRKDKCKKVLSKKDDVVSEVRTKIDNELDNNDTFKYSVQKELNSYFTNLMETNLQQVMIPIE